ncbi:hypothetical protein BX600DRAFT_144650 [Xylariales sp. PMI_506]|nr:hypothetical protein BX600DRAFT_144650 [Xylariales sp. PMI_506]
MQQTSHRPIAPRPACSDNTHERSRPMIRRSIRSHSTKVACDECRRRKSKCSGDRPACGRCRKQNFQCIYVAEPNESLGESLRRRNAQMEDQVMRLSRVLHSLRSGTDSEAYTVLTCLREANDMHNAATEIATAAQLLEWSTTHQGRAESRFDASRVADQDGPTGDPVLQKEQETDV